MKRSTPFIVVLLLIVFPLLSASADIPSDVKWGGFAVIKSDSVLFTTDFASTEIVGPIAKYTPVVCLQAVLNSDSSKYIYVMPFEDEETQVHTSGYIARTGLYFISLDEYTEIISGIRAAQEVMNSPSSETKDNVFFEIGASGHGRARTTMETQLFVSSRPDFGIRETMPVNTEVLVLMQSTMHDEGLYYFVLDTRNELTGFVYAKSIGK